MSFVRKALRAVVNYDPSFCDMYADAGSQTAARDYLTHLQHHLRECFGDRPLTILDAGCQAGRFLIPLAQAGHWLIGIDRSGFAVRRASRHARTLNLTVDLHAGDLAAVRRWVKPSSVDVALCLEVLYLCPNYRELMKLLIDSVKPGGMVAISHRPTEYYLFAALERNQWAAATELATRTNGPSPEGEYHNWFTDAQLRELYAQMRLRVLGCYAVDEHAPVSLDLSHVNGDVTRLLSPMRSADGLFHIPQYRLVIAQKGSV